MIPCGLKEFSHKKLPNLKSTHSSLLISEKAPSSVHSFAEYMVEKLR